jgi:Uma2 family endonuclease
MTAPANPSLIPLRPVAPPLPPSPAPRRVTAEEFAGMEDGPDFTLELVRGVIEKMPRAKRPHGRIMSKIDRLLGAFVEAGRLGEVVVGDTGFLISRDPDTVRGPDVAFVSSARLRTVADPDDWFPFGADLAVEITSPTDRPGRIEEKVADWLGAGTVLVWQVDPATRTVTVHRAGRPARTLTADEELDGGEVLPGFRVRVAELFV